MRYGYYKFVQINMKHLLYIVVTTCRFTLKCNTATTSTTSIQLIYRSLLISISTVQKLKNLIGLKRQLRGPSDPVMLT